MSKITQLDLWDDTGFTEGCVEVPSISNTLPTPSHTYSTQLTPDVNHMFSELKVPVAYTDIMNSSYLKITLTLNNNTTKEFYGWIDSVSIISDTPDYASSLITWHTDLWRTYLSQAVFGYGNVKRRPQSGSDPIQKIPYNYRTAKGFTSMEFQGSHNQDILWLFVNYTSDREQIIKDIEDDVVAGYKTVVTKVRTAVIPIRSDNIQQGCYFKFSGQSNTYRGISMSAVINNTFDEQLNISPASISSAYISPYPPFSVTGGTGKTSADPLVLDVDTATENYVWSSIPNNVKAISSISYGSQWVIYYTEGDPFRTGMSSTARNHVVAPFGNLVDAGGYTFNDYTYDPDNAVRGYMYIAKIDDFVKESLGDGWKDLKLNDKVRFPAGVPTFSDFSVGRPSVAHRVIIQIITSETPVTQTEFTFNGTTFGNKYIAIFTRDRVMELGRMAGTSSRNLTIDHEKSGTDATDGSWFIVSNSSNYAEFSQTLPTPIKTDDRMEWLLTDFDCNIVGTLPWGLERQTYTVRDIITSSGGYIQFRFDDWDSSANGTLFSVPMPAVDICSNSWSDYVYSGQRDYDVNQASLRRQKAVDTAVATSVYSLGTDALGMVGSALARQPIGGLGLGTVISTMAQAGIQYHMDKYYDNKLQELTDTVKAKQLDSIQTYGTGWDWFHHGRKIGFVNLVADDYSLINYDNCMLLNGIVCNEPTPDCTTLIETGGALQIENLIVTGSIPVEAKQFIKDRLSQGVRII